MAELKMGGTLNGLDLDLLGKVVNAVKHDPTKRSTKFRVKTTWKGQTFSETKVESYFFGGEEIRRSHTFQTDEPLEQCGTNRAPNPQEYLMGALNACMTVGYVAACSLNGITLEKLEIETEGELDLRGFLAIDQTISPGFETITYTVHIKGDGTPEQFRQVHEFVKKTSPTFYNLASATTLNANLVVE